MFRKVGGASAFLLATGFIWFGEPWIGALALRGVLGVFSILMAALFLPGFVVRDARRNC